MIWSLYRRLSTVHLNTSLHLWQVLLVAWASYCILKSTRDNKTLKFLLFWPQVSVVIRMGHYKDLLCTGSQLFEGIVSLTEEETCHRQSDVLSCTVDSLLYRDQIIIFYVYTNRTFPVTISSNNWVTDSRRLKFEQRMLRWWVFLLKVN